MAESDASGGMIETIRQFSAESSPIDFVIILEHGDLFLMGLVQTVALVGLALVIGGALSIPLSLIRAYRHPVLNPIVWVYTYTFRGTPLLLQLYLIYYGLGQFEAVRESFLWPIMRDAWWCTLFAFVLNTCAYTTEILRGAIDATPWGEVEAAKAAGMSPATRVRRIILPSAFRRALPQYSNEVIFMLHGSVVASTVTVQDILGVGWTLNGKYYLAYEGFIAAAVLYALLVWGISRLFRYLERRYLSHLRPRDGSSGGGKRGPKAPSPQPAT
ncbi:ABC transporter permease [Marivibrio halodurans]|nr:ABC transporter permease [Marivibrio halodurans]